MFQKKNICLTQNVMFEKLKTSAVRATLISFVLWVLCDFKSAFLGAASAVLYDAATDPMVQLSWRIALQIAKQRVATQQQGSRPHRAKKTMRGPIKSTLSSDSTANEQNVDDL